MSQPADITFEPKHYQAVCGIALLAVFWIQVQQDITMWLNLVFLFVGAVNILFRIRLGPTIVLLAMAGVQLRHQRILNQFGVDGDGLRFFDLSDLILCLAMLTYVASLFRLHGLWLHIFPHDPRIKRDKAAATDSQQVRSAKTMTTTELLRLLLPLPLFAFAAQIFMVWLAQQERLALPPRWRQLLAMAWFFLFVMFAAAHVFRYWRRKQMDHATAQLLLQDILWSETRGEQRRVNRWLAWRKLKDREEMPSENSGK